MAEPYYQDNLVTLHLGDCREITEWLAADVLVTDPPYGMGYETRGAAKSGRRAPTLRPIINDESTDARDAVLTAWGDKRVSLVFGRWSVVKPSGTKQVLTWDKGNHTGMGDTNIPWRPSTEEIYVRGPWPPRPSLGRGGGGRVSPVLNINATAALSQAQGRNHPTEKPVALMAALIDRCPPGTIADPFAGSGSTLVAAKMLGRKAIGVEIEERYCEIAARRLLQGALPFEVGA